jgi:hypothetical protein
MRTRYPTIVACTAIPIAVIAACSNDKGGTTTVPTPTEPIPDAAADAALDAAPPRADAGPPTADAAADAAQDAAVEVTFTTVYTTVITQHCAPCHTTAGGIGISLGMLDMTTQAKAYADLVNVPAAGASCAGAGTRVVPGDQETSITYLKISLDDPAPCGGKMPLGLPPLSQENVSLVEDWIKAGAKNN